MSPLNGASVAAFLAFILLATAPAQALEYPIGSPQNVAGMEVSAVYLHAVEMEPEGHMRKASEADIHMEADVRALMRNPNGYREGDWIPFLHIQYEITKLPAGDVIKGHFMPMVANDGPHYGDNIKLNGPGKYKVKYKIFPPNAKENPFSRYFGRHIDRTTGVGPWFQPLELEWEFTFVGVGKKGGY